MKNQAIAIDAFCRACDAARELLGPVESLNKTQRRVVLGAALKGLDSASLPYYSRAIELLLGAQDRQVLVRGKWIIKQLPCGKIRRRGPNVLITQMVDRV